MPTVRIAQHLRNQFNLPAECMVEGGSLRAVVENLDRQFTGVARYLLDDQGALRQHVNLFIGERWVRDRQRLSDPVQPQDEVFIFQALSGG